MEMLKSVPLPTCPDVLTKGPRLEDAFKETICYHRLNAKPLMCQSLSLRCQGCLFALPDSPNFVGTQVLQSYEIIR